MEIARCVHELKGGTCETKEESVYEHLPWR